MHRIAHLVSYVPRIEAAFTPVALLATRIVFGQSFVLTGLGKLQHLDQVTEFFRGLGIPFAEVQAPAIAMLEFSGGAFLLVGLATRPIAALLLSTMVVALLTADRGALLAGLAFETGLADVTPLPFLVAMLWLVTRGAGAWSLDAYVARWLPRRAVAPAATG